MQRSRSLNRELYSTLANLAAVLIWIALFGALIASIVVAYPAQTNVSNSYALPYLPVNLDVTHITNKFSQSVQLGGGPAIAMVQADELSVNDYIAKTSQTEGRNYLSISPNGQETNIDYYYERPSSNVLTHWGYQIPAPTYHKWIVSGYYTTTSYGLDGGKLVLQSNQFTDDGSDAMVAFMAILVGSMAYLLLVMWIKERSWWWY